MSGSKPMEIQLPPEGRSTELLREFRVPGFHGELVVTLNSKGEMELTVYPLEPGSYCEGPEPRSYRIL